MNIIIQENTASSGQHIAILDSIHQQKHFFSGQESERFHFKFKIIEGDSKDLFVFGFTPTNPKVGTKLHTFLCSFAGKKLLANENINLSLFIGQKYLVTVNPSKSGKNQVDSFSKLV